MKNIARTSLVPNHLSSLSFRSESGDSVRKHLRFKGGALNALCGTGLAVALALALPGCSKPADSPAMGGQSGAPPSSAASVPSATIGTEIDDSVVTAKVKAALLNDPDVKSIDFKVETRKGEVLLSGFAANQSQVDRALAVTKAVPGVKNVDNKVSLKGAPATIGNTVDDGIVTTQVKAALLADASVKSFDIAVVTRKNEVQLSGFVDNQGQSDRAVEVARGITGVSSVINDMKVKK
jgi:hyperosmotically inducible periplasmic protein